jgi:hypothetical protein
VVKIRVPVRGGMTGQTRLREVRRIVIGVCRCMIVALMTRPAIARQIVVHTAGVTADTRRGNMRTRQREIGICVIVVRIPIRSCMAGLTGRRKTRCVMIGVVSSVVIGLVTTHARGR